MVGAAPLVPRANRHRNHRLVTARPEERMSARHRRRGGGGRLPVRPGGRVRRSVLWLDLRARGNEDRGPFGKEPVSIPARHLLGTGGRRSAPVDPRAVVGRSVTLLRTRTRTRTDRRSRSSRRQGARVAGRGAGSVGASSRGPARLDGLATRRISRSDDRSRLGSAHHRFRRRRAGGRSVRGAAALGLRHARPGHSGRADGGRRVERVWLAVRMARSCTRSSRCPTAWWSNSASPTNRMRTRVWQPRCWWRSSRRTGWTDDIPSGGRRNGMGRRIGDRRAGRPQVAHERGVIG